MQSRTLSAAVVVGLIAAVVVLFVVLRDDGGDGEQATTTPGTTTAEAQRKPKQPEPEVTTIVVEGGKPAGGVRSLEYTSGNRVRFDVDSDVPEEVHVHGYDLIEDVAPGKPASFSFTADIEGGFEVELEGTHTQIAELTVEPG